MKKLSHYVKPSEIPTICGLTVRHVEAWGKELREIGIQFDTETPVVKNSIPGHVLLDHVRAKLESQRLLAQNICCSYSTDLPGLIRTVMTFDEFLTSRRYESGPIIEELNLHRSHDCMTQLMIYGKKADECFYDFDTKACERLAYLEWIPPAEGGSHRFAQSFETPDWMRYTGYWINRVSENAFTPSRLRDAEIDLYETYRQQ